MEVLGTIFFYIVTPQIDNQTYENQFLGNIYVFFTSFGCSLETHVESNILTFQFSFLKGVNS